MLCCPNPGKRHCNYAKWNGVFRGLVLELTTLVVVCTLNTFSSVSSRTPAVGELRGDLLLIIYFGDKRQRHAFLSSNNV